MNQTISLSDENTAVLVSEARAAGMPTERYLSRIVVRARGAESWSDDGQL